MIYYLFLHTKDLPGARHLTLGHSTSARADVAVIFHGDMGAWHVLSPGSSRQDDLRKKMEQNHLWFPFSLLVLP